ncbi:MAG: hypothetical protein Q8O56_15195 [Solirubrobacteraceae bacterium]|nr:hypothetical protein [Solirubrobacteraceae bacterium]
MADGDTRRAKQARDIRRISPGHVRYDAALRIADNQHAYQVWLRKTMADGRYNQLAADVRALAPAPYVASLMRSVSEVHLHAVTACELHPIASEAIGIIAEFAREVRAPLRDAWTRTCAKMTDLDKGFRKLGDVWAAMIESSDPDLTPLGMMQNEVAHASRLLDAAVAAIQRGLFLACDAVEALVPLLEQADETVETIEIDDLLMEPITQMEHQLAAALHCSRHVLYEVHRDRDRSQPKPRVHYRPRYDRFESEVA